MKELEQDRRSCFEMARLTQGVDAFEFVRKCAEGRRPWDVDVLIICDSTEGDAAEYVGQSVAGFWQEGLGAVDEGKLQLPEHLCAFTKFVNGHSGAAKAMPGGTASEKVDPFFAALPGDCDDCCSSRPSLKTVILEATYLLKDDFLEDLTCLVYSNQIMVIPVLTNKFLSQAELVIRTKSLKPDGSYRKAFRYLVPAYTEPLRVPNFLFRGIKGMEFFYVNRQGTVFVGVPPGREELLQKTILHFFVEKINKHRLKRKSDHGGGQESGLEAEGNPGGDSSG